jgi:hypothetical protein
MKNYIETLIGEVIFSHLKKIRLERLSISERIGLELAIVKLKVIRELISKFNIN